MQAALFIGIASALSALFGVIILRKYFGKSSIIWAAIEVGWSIVSIFTLVWAAWQIEHRIRINDEQVRKSKFDAAQYMINRSFDILIGPEWVEWIRTKNSRALRVVGNKRRTEEKLAMASIHGSELRSPESAFLICRNEFGENWVEKVYDANKAFAPVYGYCLGAALAVKLSRDGTTPYRYTQESEGTVGRYSLAWSIPIGIALGLKFLKALNDLVIAQNRRKEAAEKKSD